jgi:RNA recognition motif-containing protein
MSYRGGGNYYNGHQQQRGGLFKSNAHKNNRYTSKNPVKYNSGSSGHHQSQYQSSRNNYQNQYKNNQYQNNQYQNANYQQKSNLLYPNKYNSSAYHQDKKYDPFQIWMGDLDPTWDEATVTKIWVSVGESPTGVKILKDKSGAKPPYCFVSFSDQNQITSAIQKNGQQMPGYKKHFKLNWASGSGNNQGGNTNARFHNDSSHGSHFDRIPTNKADNTSCFIGDLPVDATETLIFERFNDQYPNQVRQVKIMYDPVTRASKGYGFVKFNSQEIAKKALEMNGVIIGSNPIKVDLPAHSTAATTQPIKTDPHIQLAQSQPTLTQFTDSNNTTLLIRNLNQKLTKKELEMTFLPFGDLVYCRLSQNRETAYIKFYLRTSAENAITSLHGATINMCHLKVTWGKDDQESSSYKKCVPSPLVYGEFSPYHVNLSETKLDTQVIDSSELLPVSNELYVKTKVYRDTVLEESY